MKKRYPGRTWIDAKGYVRIYIVRGHWMYEHRYVMEQKLGRPLARTEHVHHKNGVRDDNLLDNLEVLSASTHIARHNAAHPKRRRVSVPVVTNSVTSAEKSPLDLSFMRLVNEYVAATSDSLF